MNTSSISVLAGYIVGLPETRQPADWPPLINYITDAVSDGARVDFVRVTNLPSDELRDAVLAMMITQDMNTRSKTDKTYHMIFSFPPGEKPSREILNDIEDNLVASIGLGEHQRISAAHDDKDHYHVHIAINKVHPKTYRNVEPFYDKNALMRTCAELERKHGLMITNHGELAEAQSKTRQTNYEVRDNGLNFGNGESLQSWIQNNAKAQLLEAFKSSNSWDEFHTKSTEIGLEFKLRGAGIVIKAIGQDVAVKASTIDRGLSFKALTSKFGEFKPAILSSKQNQEIFYDKSPKLDKEASKELYTQFQKERSEAIAKRREAKIVLKGKKENAAKIIKAAFSNKRLLVKNNKLIKRLGKKLEYQKLAIEQMKVWQVYKNTYSQEKKKIDKDLPLLTWFEFLTAKAQKGNEHALELLRNHERNKEKFTGNILKCDDVGEAKNIILKELSPIVRRNGDIVYFIKDGGRVADSKRAINIENVSTGAALLALSLAQEKFEGKALKINGSDAFKREIIIAASSKNLDIRFTDKAINDALEVIKNQKTSKLPVVESATNSLKQKPPRKRGR